MTESMNEVSLEAVLLLRDQLLPNLLGEEIDEILYWAGKELARKHLMNHEEEIVDFFFTNGFGSLEQIEMKKNRRLFILNGTIVQSRIKQNNKAVFSLETGFLAEQLQRISDTYSEASYEVKEKKAEVYITVQMDPKEELPRG